MTLGRVIGTVWGAKQTETLRGRRIVVVRPLTLRGLREGVCIGDDVPAEILAPTSLLAVDPLGADVGQNVLVSIGSRVRDLVTSPFVPTKHCVIAIVDEARLGA